MRLIPERKMMQFCQILYVCLFFTHKVSFGTGALAHQLQQYWLQKHYDVALL